MAANAKAVSNAEWTLRSAFERLGILDGSFQNYDFPFSPQICKKYNTEIKGTNIDRHYPDQRIAIYFDGPHHLKENQEKKDEKIDEILRHEFHYVVKRYKFHTMTKGRAYQIGQEVKAVLELMGYQPAITAKVTLLKCGFCEDLGKETIFIEDGDEKNCDDAYAAIADHMWKVHCLPQVKVI